MASLDAARRQLAVHGEALLDRTIKAAAHAREAIDAIPGCSVLNESLVGRPGIAGWDPLRIVVDVRRTGCTGYDVAAALRASYEAIAGYPPGVPALLPGERVTQEVIRYLRALTAAGARLHGAADPTFTTVRVLVENGR